jgi:hypothetical protein
MGVVLKDFKTRFWERVKKTDSCWLWCGAKHEDGFGIFQGGRKLKMRRAHRIAYELLVGPIPAGMEVATMCKNRLCVNPMHFVLQTPREGRQVKKRVLRAVTVRKIMHLRALGWMQQRIATELGVSIYSVRCITQGRTWQNVTGLKKPEWMASGQPRRKRS